MDRESMVFYRSWMEAIKNLPKEIQGEVLTTIVEYGLFGKVEGEIQPISKAMLAMVKPQIDANNSKYENGKKGSEYGKLGGRPKKIEKGESETASEPQTNETKTPRKPQENPKETPNVYVYVNDNVNENENTPLNPPTQIFESIKEKLIDCQIWIESFAMSTGYGLVIKESMPDLLDSFFAYIISIGQENSIKTVDDAKRRFTYWWRDYGQSQYKAIAYVNEPLPENPDDTDHEFKRFKKWMQNRAPSLLTMRQLLTKSDYMKILELCNGNYDLVTKTLLELNNDKFVIDKKISVYDSFKEKLNYGKQNIA